MLLILRLLGLELGMLLLLLILLRIALLLLLRLLLGRRVLEIALL